jgi:hypothetical protein
VGRAFFDSFSLRDFTFDGRGASELTRIVTNGLDLDLNPVLAARLGAVNDIDVKSLALAQTFPHVGDGSPIRLRSLQKRPRPGSLRSNGFSHTARTVAGPALSG